VLTLALLGSSAVPSLAQAAPAGSPVPSLPAGAEPADEGAAVPDLWFHHGSTLTRVDGRNGAILERRDLSGAECQVASDLPVFAGPGREDILLRRGAFEFAEFDPDYVVVGDCILRLPLDGSAEESHAIWRAQRTMVVSDVAVVGDAIWVVAWDRTSRQDALDDDSDLTLYRLDEQSGELDPVIERALSVTPSVAGPIVLYSKDDTPRQRRVGLLGASSPPPLELAALRGAIPAARRSAFPWPRLRLSGGADGLLALYDRTATGDILVFDPVSDSLVATLSPAGRIGSLGSVYPTARGAWMDGQRANGRDFVRYSGYDGATLDIDPCGGVPGPCFGSLVASTEDGVWVSAWPYDEESFQVDLSAARLRRYTDGSSVPTLELSGSDLFGP
jgi:hypothetical protein